jgi:hypothetical protein
MNESFILVVAVFGFIAAVQAAMLAHRHPLPIRLLQGVEWNSTGRLVRNNPAIAGRGGKKVCLMRWPASILQLAVEQGQTLCIEPMPGQNRTAKKASEQPIECPPFSSAATR